MDHFFQPDPTHSAFYFVRLILGLIAGFFLLGALQLIPNRFRKTVIAIVTFVGGALYAAEFFWPSNFFGHSISNPITNALPIFGTLTTIFQASAAGLGIISLLGLHFRSLSRRKEGWGYSAVLVTAFFAMLVWGLLNAYNPGGVVVPKVGFLNAQITNEDMYDLLFYGGFNNLDSAMFALIGFFIISASYRAFRIRSVEASLLMIAAVIVMLGQVTLGQAMTHNLPATGLWSNFRLENMAQYILVQINTPALRAIYFGIGVGFLATSLRLWLSLERGVYFDTEL